MSSLAHPATLRAKRRRVLDLEGEIQNDAGQLAEQLSQLFADRRANGRAD